MSFLDDTVSDSEGWNSVDISPDLVFVMIVVVPNVIVVVHLAAPPRDL